MMNSSPSTPPNLPQNLLESNNADVDLPPVICSNTREKIKGENIPVTELAEANEKKYGRKNSLRNITAPAAPLKPIPHYSLTIAWAPSYLCLNLDEEAVVKLLTVQNRCTHTIYIQCCGLWDSTGNAKLGASWKIYPHTRFLLAPGLMACIVLRAAPREYPPPFPSAYVALHLAASHMRDNVTGHFMVPIQAIFNNYIPPPQYIGEE